MIMPPQAPARIAVTAPPGSRLEELMAAYDGARAAAEDAAARFKAITDAIKSEAAASRPGVAEMALSSGSGTRLLMTWKRPWKFDTGRFREDHPDMYVRYASQSGHWELRAQS